MKKYYFIFFIIFISTISCKKDQKISNTSEIDRTKIVKPLPPLDYEKYMRNVPKTDSLCNGEIEIVKNDLLKYDGVYVHTICFGCDFKPYEEEIKEVLKRKKFKLGIQDLGCVIYDGQTQGCYRAYIDLKMKAKYGENYRSEIENEAINILIKNISINNKIISIYDLEPNEKPKILNPKIVIESDYYTTIKTDLPINRKSMHHLFTDINFIVEKDGTISNLKETNWVNEKGIDKKYKQDIINLTLSTLRKDYNNWKPGTYKGNKARVENTLRVSFE